MVVSAGTCESVNHQCTHFSVPPMQHYGTALVTPSSVSSRAHLLLLLRIDASPLPLNRGPSAGLSYINRWALLDSFRLIRSSLGTTLVPHSPRHVDQSKSGFTYLHIYVLVTVPNRFHFRCVGFLFLRLGAVRLCPGRGSPCTRAIQFHLRVWMQVTGLGGI